MAEVLAWDGEKLAPVPGVTVDGGEPLVAVFDEDKGEQLLVPVAEAGRGMLRYARALKPGSAARGEVERRAITMAELAGAWPPWKRKRGRRG